MDPITDFLARAVEAERQAARGTGAFRTQLLGLAELWRGMALKAKLLGQLEEMLARGDLDPTAPVRTETPPVRRPRARPPAGPRTTTGEPGK